MGAGRRGWLLAVGGALAEVCLLNFSFLVAFVIRLGGHPPVRNVEAFFNLTPWLSGSLLVLLAVYGVYSRVRRPWPELLYSLLCAYLLAFLLGLALSFWLRSFSLPRGVFLIGMGLYAALSLGGHRLAWRVGLARSRPFRTVVVSADEQEAARFASALPRLLPGTYRPVAAVMTPAPATTANSDCGLAAGPALAAVTETVEAVLVCPSVPVSARLECLELCLERGLQFLVVPGVYEIAALRSQILQAGDLALLTFRDVRLGPDAQVSKRAIDLLLGALVLLATAPIMGLVSLAVWLDSPGPVLYRQARVGKDGREFVMFKFRTMVPDAEARSGPVLSQPGDSRITRVGGLLRKTRLDELPQILNVLRGDMSLVGPRPERPWFVGQHADAVPGYTLRHCLQPGLTGLAQVAGGYSSSPQDKLRLDLLYAVSFSPLLDLTILLQTLRAVLMHRGSE